MSWSLSSARTSAARAGRPLLWSETLGFHGIEVPRLGRYVVVAAMVGGCALLSVWSRIDYRKTALALDATESAFEEAKAENARLDLELAALRDPGRLAAASAALSLASDVNVIDISDSSPKPATP